MNTVNILQYSDCTVIQIAQKFLQTDERFDQFSSQRRLQRANHGIRFELFQSDRHELVDEDLAEVAMVAHLEQTVDRVVPHRVHELG